MLLTLHTETTIDSCHVLRGYDGQCAQMHGHTWKIKLGFRGDSSLCDDVGILVDFGIVKELRNKLDHKCLNDVIEGVNPTAENIVQFIYEYIRSRIKPGIQVAVRVYETAVDKNTFCEGGDFALVA